MRRLFRLIMKKSAVRFAPARDVMTESVLHDHEADATFGSGEIRRHNGYIVGQIYAKNWMRISAGEGGRGLCDRVRCERSESRDT